MSDIMKHEIVAGQPEGTFTFYRGEVPITVETKFTNPQLEKLFALADEGSNWQLFLEYRTRIANKGSGFARELVGKDFMVPYAFVLRDKEHALRCLNYLELLTAAFAIAAEDKVSPMTIPVGGADFIQVCQALNGELVELLGTEKWYVSLVGEDTQESRLLEAIYTALDV